MSIKPCVASRAKRLCYPNRLSFCSCMQIPKFPTPIKACFYVALQRTAWCCGRLTLQTKINSDLCTMALAHPTSHTGCTQALWREVGVRNGGCEVAHVSWQCNSSFQVKKKKSATMILIVTPPVARGLTSMLRICVSYFFCCYARTLACCTCSYTVRKLLPSRTFPSWHSPAPY